MRKLTVLMQTYNRESYISESIESILNQSFSDFDLVILDNASTDKTSSIVGAFNDERIEYIKNEINIGAIANGNKGLDLIRNVYKSKYVSFFHDDDIMHPNLLEKEIQILDSNEEIILVSSNASSIDSHNNPLKERLYNMNKDLELGQYEYIEKFFKGEAQIHMPTVMVRRNIFDENSFVFRDEVGPASDAYMWFEINKLNKKICILAEPLLKYRIHENQDSKMNYYNMNLDLFRASQKFFESDENLYEMKPLLKNLSKRVMLNYLLKNTLQSGDTTFFYEKLIQLKNEEFWDENYGIKYKLLIYLAKNNPYLFRLILKIYLDNKK